MPNLLHLLTNLFHRDQFSLAAPMVGAVFSNAAVNDDADLRRIGHDAEAIRTRFEQSPLWPDPGVRDERR